MDLIDSQHQSANYHYWSFEYWPLSSSFPFSLHLPLDCSFFISNFSWIRDRVPDRVKRKILVEVPAVRLKVCYWCSEIQKCSAFFSETHSVWRLCSFQAQTWLPTSDMLVTCCAVFLKIHKISPKIIFGGVAEWKIAKFTYEIKFNLNSP